MYDEGFTKFTGILLIALAFGASYLWVATREAIKSFRKGRKEQGDRAE